MRSKQTAGFLLGLSLLVLPLALGGCSSDRNPDRAPPLIAEPNSPVADAPVPTGYKIMDSRSSSQVIPANNQRFVDHSYSGGGSVLQAVRFYQDVMPTRGWTGAGLEQGHKETTLRFTKNKETAQVTVWRGTFDTHIRIKIGPTAADAGK